MSDVLSEADWKWWFGQMQTNPKGTGRVRIEAHDKALRERVAVLTEERDAARHRFVVAEHDWVAQFNAFESDLADAEARVAVLEAGLREWERIAATVVDGGSVDEDDLERHLTDTRSLLCAPNDRSAQACLTELVATIEIAVEAGSLVASSERAIAALAAARALLGGVPAAAPEEEHE
jgi:hypothetical protein